MSCKDNFIHSLKSVLKDQFSDDATFKEWFPIAANETLWNSLIETHFHKLCADDTVHEYVLYVTLRQIFWGQRRRTLTPTPDNRLYASKRKNLEITEKLKKLSTSDSYYNYTPTT